MNSVTTYRITLKHDRGKARLTVVSLSGISGAVAQVTTTEACPESAIIKIERISR